LLVISLSACAVTTNDSAQPVPAALPIQSDISAAPVPPGIDAELWAQLTAELARVVAARGKVTSLAAQGRGSRVLDFWLLDNSGGVGFWGYRNQGDYDLNGLVTISDLTPIGAHFGKRSNDPNWETIQVVDGDSNGEINISDVTPLGNNFGARVAGYVIQEKDSLISDYETIGFVDLSQAQLVQGGYPYFFLVPIAGQPLRWYRVVPSATDVAPYELGVPSNNQGFIAGIPRQPWAQRGADQYRRNLTEVKGPTSIGTTWSVDLQGGAFGFGGPVADRNGLIYCSSMNVVTENLPSFEGSTGSVWCVDRDGNVQWRYQTDAAIPAQPVLMADGTVVAQTYRNKLIALTPDGKVRWTQQLTTDNAAALNELTVDEEAGFIFAFDSGPSMRRIDYFGNISATEPLVTALESAIAPVVAADWILIPHSGSTVDARLRSSGTLDSSGQFPDSIRAGMLFNPNTSVLWAGQQGSGATLHGIPFDVGNPVSHISTNYLSTPPSLLPTGEIVIGELIPSAIPSDPPTGVIKGIDPVGGAANWDRPLDVAPSGGIACDTSGRCFFGAYGIPGATGIYCVDSNHNVEWFHPTGGTLFTGVSIVDDDIVAGIHALSDNIFDAAELVGVSGP
jgi:hypothetical protein